MPGHNAVALCTNVLAVGNVVTKGKFCLFVPGPKATEIVRCQASTVCILSKRNLRSMNRTTKKVGQKENGDT